jgi:hypothetical protein
VSPRNLLLYTFAAIGLFTMAMILTDDATDALGGWQRMYSAPKDGTVIEVRHIGLFGFESHRELYRWDSLDGHCQHDWRRVDDPHFGIVVESGNFRWRAAKTR